MMERIINEMMENGGCSRLNLYPMIEKVVNELKGSESCFQLIEDVSWTADDIYDVMQMVGEKLRPKLKKKLKGRKISCQMHKNGILEFRLKK